jgi:hypothetical protein
LALKMERNACPMDTPDVIGEAELSDGGKTTQTRRRPPLITRACSPKWR